MLPPDAYAASSSRWSRTWAVLMPYFTRKWACVLVATWLLPLIYSLCVKHTNHSMTQSESIFPRARVNSLAELEEFARESPVDSVDVELATVASKLLQDLHGQNPQLSMSQLTESVERIQPTLARLRNIGKLSLGAWVVSDETLRQLSQLHSIERLEIDTTLRDVPLNLAALGSVPVRVLELHLEETERTQLAGLDQLSSLEELRFTTSAFIPRELLRQAARLPRLRVVEIPYRPDLGDKEKSPLQELSESRSLKWVEAGCTYDNAKWLQQIGEQVRVPVHANRYSATRRLWFTSLFGGMTLAGTALCLIATLQFTLPWAEILPRYKPAHEQIVWSLIAGQILLETWHLVHLRGSAMSALSFSVAVTSAFWFFSIQSNIAFLVNRLIFRWVGPLILLMTVGAVFWNFQQPVAVDAFLTGQYRWVQVIFCQVALACGLRIHLLLPRLSRATVAANIDPFLTSNPWSKEAHSQRYQLTIGRQKSTGESDPYELNFRIFFAVSITALIGVIFWRTGILRLGSRFETILQVGIVILFYWLMLSIMFVWVRWWSRMPFLATEMVRPPLRSRQLSRLFWNVARDYRMVVPILLVFALINDGWMASHGRPPLERVIPSLLLLSASLASYALILWLLPVRSGLKVLFILASLLIGFVGLAFSMPLMFSEEVFSDSTSRCRIGLGAAGILTVISLLAILAARERYRRMEWGKML